MNLRGTRFRGPRRDQAVTCDPQRNTCAVLKQKSAPPCPGRAGFTDSSRTWTWERNQPTKPPANSHSKERLDGRGLPRGHGCFRFLLPNVFPQSSRHLCPLHAFFRLFTPRPKPAKLRVDDGHKQTGPGLRPPRTRSNDSPFTMNSTTGLRMF